MCKDRFEVAAKATTFLFATFVNRSKPTWVTAATWTAHRDLTPRVGQFTIYHVCHSWTAPLQALPGRGILALPRPLDLLSGTKLVAKRMGVGLLALRQNVAH